MESDYIDDRLRRWAKWAISGRPQLGLSDRTALYEMVRSGIIARGYGTKPEPDAGEEEMTEAGLQYIRTKETRSFEVIAIHYLGRGTTKQKYADMDMTKHEYHLYLRRGQQMLEVWLDAKEAA